MFDFRASIHKSAHILAVERLALGSVLRVTIGDRSATVSRAGIDTAATDVRCAVAGIAAELLIFGCAKWPRSTSDLQNARRAIAEATGLSITDLGETKLHSLYLSAIAEVIQFLRKHEPLLRAIAPLLFDRRHMLRAELREFIDDHERADLRRQRDRLRALWRPVLSSGGSVTNNFGPPRAENSPPDVSCVA